MRRIWRRNGVSGVDQCWHYWAGGSVTSIRVLPARGQIAAFVINPHFKSKKVGAAQQLRLKASTRSKPPLIGNYLQRY